MRKRYGLIIVGFILCMVIAAAAAQETIVTVKSVNPEEIYVYGGGCSPNTTVVTLEVAGYGGGGVSDTLAVVFAIDSSGSMSWTDSSGLRISAANAFVDKLCTTPENDKAGIVSWDSAVDFTYGLVAESDDSFATLKNRINSVNSAGGTNLDAGLNAAITMMDSGASGDKKIIIFLTDGNGVYTPSGTPGSPTDAAAAKGITIYTIGLNIISGTYIEGKLIEIATNTGGTYYSSPTAKSLDAIFSDIYSGVASTAPYNIDLTEVTESYIVAEGDFSIIPEEVTENPDGTTTMTWTNIGQYVGNGNDRLDASETFVVSFTAGSAISGSALAVNNLSASYVRYMDPQGGVQTAPVGQAYLDVLECVVPVTPEPTPSPTPPPSVVPEFPVAFLPMGIVISLGAIAFMLRR